jgi:ribosomal protein S8
VDRIVIYEFTGLGSNPNKLLMNLALHNLFTTIESGFLKKKNKVLIAHSETTIRTLKYLQSEGFIRYFEIKVKKNQIVVYLPNLSTYSSFKVLSKVQKRQHFSKKKSLNISNLNLVYFSNSCSYQKKTFGECLFILR